MNDVRKQITVEDGKTMIEISLTMETPYTDCGDVCGIYTRSILVDDSKVNSILKELDSCCDKYEDGGFYDEEEDNDEIDDFYDTLDDIYRKFGGVDYYPKRGDKISIEYFERDFS